MTGKQATAEAIRQMIDGEDYTPLANLINDLTPEQAVTRPAGSPYSIATLVWHTWYWVNFWVVAIQGEGDPRGGITPDETWPPVLAEDWLATRARMFEVLEKATGLVETADLDRIVRRSESVGANLLQIAIHTAYHIGQITLVRQELGFWPPMAGE